MKVNRNSNYTMIAGIVSGLIFMSACGAGNVSTTKNSNSPAANASGANTAVAETKNTDTSPITIGIVDLFTESDAGTASSMRQKYAGRQMTVTGGVLYEFKVDMLRVGKGQNPDFGTQSSAPEYFVSCGGTFDDNGGREGLKAVLNLKSGKATAITVKGIFKEASSYSNKHWVILEQCSKVGA